jgi:hypothetical protein
MSYFGRQTETLDAGQTEAFELPAGVDPVYAGASGAPAEPLAAGEAVQTIDPSVGQDQSVGARLAGFRERVVRALQSLDRGPVDQPQLEAGTEQAPEELLSEVSPPSHDARLPIGPFGYSRGAVDERIASLEQEIATLEQELHGVRDSQPPISITGEIERLGEQTASILVVAHGQAHETTRKAQEDAERCLADATLNANLLTEEAKRRLEEIDGDTDAVWRERARLLTDARDVGLALIALAEEAAERFPAEVRTTEVPQAGE